MAVAAKGWITPSEACECVEMQDDWGDDDTWLAKQAASASRALRRLVRRGLLVYCRPKYLAQSPAYRLPKFHGELPYNNSAHATHGDSNTQVYRVYHAMLSRCYNPKVERYPLYGGAGVRVCARWLGEHGFKNFRADMRPRPKGTSVSRHLDSGNYEPENCEWGNISDQAAERKGKTAMIKAHGLLGQGGITESRRALSEDLSVEDGRKVLVGILERRRLTGNKELGAGQ